jgi:hypothetical protein
MPKLPNSPAGAERLLKRQFPYKVHVGGVLDAREGLSKSGHAVNRQTRVPTPGYSLARKCFEQNEFESPFQLEGDVQVSGGLDHRSDRRFGSG